MSPCEHIGGMIVCRATIITAQIIHTHCPTCETYRNFVAFLEAWYGWRETCLWCGERWQECERLPRPFLPRWRKISVEKAKNEWRGWVASGAKSISYEEAYGF